ncbi:MAG TPA: TonB-dependent receptor plug domain-containing protein, partial [Agriterribacter sp.]|nr:TonB-dependent receptor plug domain-containing protein [Agriterribacter sp.]
MKITVLLLVIPFLHATAEGYSQERFSLNLDQVEAAKVFANIQKTSAYRFFYLQNDIKKIGKINIHVTDATIPEIMQKVLGNTLAYKILNNYMVVISPSQADLVSQIDVRGRVTDEAGEPLQGTSVKVKGQSVGVTTEADGSFSIAVDAKAVLEISMVGYETIEIPVNGRNQLDNIVLKIAASGLDEVIVVGYGTQKKASVTGAIATMKADEVKDIPVPNLSSALAGRLSGVYVNQSSGAPGYAPAIRVRSVNTWKSTGNDPLYVIDGIISDKRLFDAMDYNEVENITVLKDAASGAIYGARAANGVILVTTKKGASGKFQLNYSYSYSFDNPSKIPQYVGAKDMVRLNNEARTYRGLPPMYDDEEVAFFNENDPAKAWYTLAYRDPTLQRHS